MWNVSEDAEEPVRLLEPGTARIAPHESTILNAREFSLYKGYDFEEGQLPKEKEEESDI